MRIAVIHLLKQGYNMIFHWEASALGEIPLLTTFFSKNNTVKPNTIVFIPFLVITKKGMKTIVFGLTVLFLEKNVVSKGISPNADASQ